jgi:hypothetical protein
MTCIRKIQHGCQLQIDANQICTIKQVNNDPILVAVAMTCWYPLFRKILSSHIFWANKDQIMKTQYHLVLVNNPTACYSLQNYYFTTQHNAWKNIVIIYTLHLRNSLWSGQIIMTLIFQLAALTILLQMVYHKSVWRNSNVVYYWGKKNVQDQAMIYLI